MARPGAFDLRLNRLNSLKVAAFRNSGTLRCTERSKGRGALRQKQNCPLRGSRLGRKLGTLKNSI